jgi:hypothetical protein
VKEDEVSTTWWGDDTRLLATLDDALRSAAEVPAGFVRTARACYLWHGIDAEIATLTYDSAARREPALTRTGVAEVRALTFTSPRLSVHLQVHRHGLHGQLVPPDAGEVELWSIAGPGRRIQADDVGWFVVRPLPTGAFRLRCRVGDETAVFTDWITL